MRPTKNATRCIAAAALFTLLSVAAALAEAAVLSLSDAEASGLDVGTGASSPEPRSPPAPAGLSTRSARDSEPSRSETGSNPPLSKAAIAAREADARRRALLDEELRANPAQVLRDAPPAAPTTYGEAAPRAEPSRARDEEVPLSSTQKSFVRSVITAVREVVQHPLTWAAVALLGVGAAVMSVGRHRRSTASSARRTPARASAPAPTQPPRVVATVRHRPRRRH